MPKFQFDHDTMPTPEEFAQLLRDGDEQYDPVEELLSLERELAQFEQKHNISSAEFYHQYQNGQAGDAVEFVSWAGRYKLYLSLKQAISNSLKLVLADKTLAST
ncbi:MAG: hypothetical protein HYR94_10410 [Chloroflexi bacterium]|nr:hypothetical protein [Chloroflexota bacterium]